MNVRILLVATSVLFVCSVSTFVYAANDAKPDSTPPPAGSAPDEAAQKKIDQKAEKLVGALKLADADKSAKVKAVTRDWLTTMLTWHKQHDAELKDLWSQWNKARAVVPKDEFPGEVIAYKIDDVYASLKPAYEQYVKRLSAELTPEQVDKLKETWSRSPGMTRTYNAYLQIVPDLSDTDKQVIHDRLAMAREAAMLTDSDKEIVSIYKRHKVKVEQYIGQLEWAKLRQTAFAGKGKAGSGESGAKKTSKSGDQTDVAKSPSAQ